MNTDERKEWSDAECYDAIDRALAAHQRIGGSPGAPEGLAIFRAGLAAAARDPVPAVDGIVDMVQRVDMPMLKNQSEADKWADVAKWVADDMPKDNEP